MLITRSSLRITLGGGGTDLASYYSKFGVFLKGIFFWDFIGILYSAKEVYCLVTGTATLGAAIGKKINVFYTGNQNKIFRHSPNNNYIQL